MMGDLPRKSDGLILMGDLPRKSDGLILMGDLSKKRWWSHYDGWPTQEKMVVSLWWVTYPEKMIRMWIGRVVMGDLLKKY
jgi:hypothetical protein